MMRGFLMVVGGLALAGCAGENSDLKQFVKDSGGKGPVAIEPLPQVKPFEPFAYEGFDLPDPFKPRKLVVKQNDGGGLQPDLNRRKEPLEAFPLDTVSMVGSLIRQGQPVALVRVDNLLYQVRNGSYLGQNYGRVSKVSETGLSVREIVQDATGEWIERTATLQLQEGSK